MNEQYETSLEPELFEGGINEERQKVKCYFTITF